MIDPTWKIFFIWLTLSIDEMNPKDKALTKGSSTWFP